MKQGPFFSKNPISRHVCGARDFPMYLSPSNTKTLQIEKEEEEKRKNEDEEGPASLSKSNDSPQLCFKI